MVEEIGMAVEDEGGAVTETEAAPAAGQGGGVTEVEAPEVEVEAAPKPTPPTVPAQRAEDWTPPSREEWAKVTASLKDASGESAARKKRLREMEQKLADLEAANATAEERAALELKKRVLQEAEAAWRPKLVAAAMRSAVADAGRALAEAGCKTPARFAKLIDLGQVEVDDDGVITGVEERITEQVAAFKNDYPEAFKRDRGTVPEPRAAQPGAVKDPKVQKSATARQAAALLSHM